MSLNEEGTTPYPSPTSLTDAPPSAPDTDSQHALEILVSSLSDDAHRAIALRHLDLPEDTPVVAVAVAGPVASHHTVVEQLAADPHDVHSARLGTVTMALVRADRVRTSVDLPLGCRMSVSAAHAARVAAGAWLEASGMLRFALPSTHESGPYSAQEACIVATGLVTQLDHAGESPDADGIDGIADLRGLDSLEAHDPHIIEILDAVAVTTDLRHAAERLHLHHHAVTVRVASAELVLGFALTDEYGRSRLLVALTLRKLRDLPDFL